MPRPTTPSHTPPSPATGRRHGLGGTGTAPRSERRRQQRRRDRRAERGGFSRWTWWLGGGAAVSVAAVGIAVVTGAVGSTSAAPQRPAAPAGTQSFTEKSRQHVTGHVTYDHSPPAGGNHSSTWLNCGIYVVGVPNESVVHSLEHGAVWITYMPTLPADQVQRLQDLAVSRYDGPNRYIVLSPYYGLSAPITVTAWGAQLKLTSASDPRLGQFIDHFRESPQAPEPGGACTGGAGRPLA
ncbi:MAG TPA: DUF3105 domain-containing protein [Candidatus Dormibacteraeota bacterium]|jgi:hypothetical protein|nr:DUF3105 domain-containing protein [Candidatus Dormibacteraeota bacterium]